MARLMASRVAERKPMIARLITRYADDPRVVTILVTSLVAGVLWIGTWASMSGMAGMQMDMGGSGMSGSGMSGSMDGSGMSGSGMTGSGMSGQMEGNMSGQMSGGMDMGMMTPGDWSAGTITATILMWILMMAAMMLPSMAPIMAIYAGIASKEDRGARLGLRITLFALGYFVLWAGFSVVAALGQLGLRGSEWFSMGGTVAGPYAAGVLLIAAGAYQFTPVKEFCLRHCRHPLTYLMSHWREGMSGAFPVGARHGVYCLGCCVALMGLMFIFGAMNVLWMAVIALYFLAEKVLPKAELWGRLAGGLMILAGLVTLARHLF
ncbi:MAG: DUF2182 domain-containing protein [Pseudomonadota bacterium]